MKSNRMRSAMLILAVCLAATAVEGRMEKHAIKRRGAGSEHRDFVKRQIVGGPGDVGTNQPTSAGAADSPAVTSPVSSPVESEEVDTPASSATQPFNPLTNLIPANSNTAVAPSSATLVVPTSSSIATHLLSSSATSISSSATGRSSAATSADRESTDAGSVDVVNVTSTALIAASLSSVAAAASASVSKAAEKDEGGGGLNKTAMIAIIAIASGVGLIAAIWTIFRKWKLSPSRQFEDKLTPIDWTPEMAGAHRSEDKLALTRSNSGGSGVSSTHKGGSAVGPGMRRQNSWGSANGSMAGYGSRTDMSEVPYSAGMMPAYPPANQYAYSDHSYSDQGYAPQQQQRHAPNPYENLQRQPTGFTNGGRYGEGYNRTNY